MQQNATIIVLINAKYINSARDKYIHNRSQSLPVKLLSLQYFTESVRGTNLAI
jgi:hypothetical protein